MHDAKETTPISDKCRSEGYRIQNRNDVKEATQMSAYFMMANKMEFNLNLNLRLLLSLQKCIQSEIDPALQHTAFETIGKYSEIRCLHSYKRMKIMIQIL
jgi:hypothetical protein